jgi:hypothetical protein
LHKQRLKRMRVARKAQAGRFTANVLTDQCNKGCRAASLSFQAEGVTRYH